MDKCQSWEKNEYPVFAKKSDDLEFYMSNMGVMHVIPLEQWITRLE